MHDVTLCLACERVADFLSALDDGSGRWRDGESTDLAHPNDRGHCEMLKVARPAVEAVLDRLHAERDGR